jgi:glycosyltransferase involved in cell wall biosynthesis
MSGGPPPLRHRPATRAAHPYEPIARVERDGAAPLLDPVPGMAERERLHLAFAIPPFGIGSGGHNTVFQLVARLERLGHTCSLWMHDPTGAREQEWPAVLRRKVVEHFAPVRAPLIKEFDHFYGADVVVATGWQTVFPVLLLEGCRARAYLLNDHEPEFFATSMERRWAEESYSQGLYGIAGTPWLRDLYVERYHGRAEAFEYGVDHETYRPRDVARRHDTIVFYGRESTPRRAVALGILALHELHRRRPDVRIVLFGNREPPDAPFPYEHVGVADSDALAWLYSEGTVGLCLSLTNYSTVPLEMLACGLPCVELDRPSPRSVYGADGPVELVAPTPGALAAAVEGLLDDRARWERRSRDGLAFVAPRTWDRAGEQVEAGLRRALALRA